MPKWWEPTLDGTIPAVPWLGPDVIPFLDRLLQPDWKVCEHGSGGSTLWFAERVAQVVAVESDHDWLGKVEAAIPANVELIFSESQDPPKKLLRRKGFDLLLIDGMPVDDRAGWLDAAEKLVRTGGYVVLDNANRPELEAARARLIARAELVCVFDENSLSAGTRFLVTEFYRLPDGREAADADRAEP